MPVTSFNTTDVDEASAVASRVFYRHTLEPIRPKNFAANLTFGTFGKLTAGLVNYSSELRSDVGGLDMTYSVGVPLRGDFDARFGRTDVNCNTSTAIVATPTSRISFRGWTCSSDTLLVLKLDRETLDGHLRKLLGREHVGEIRFNPSLNLAEGRGAQWLQLASTLALTLTSASSSSERDFATNPLMSAQLSSLIMTGLLLATDNPYRDDLDAWTKPIASRLVRHAVEIIESRANEPLTIPDIAAEIGCSVRSLQLGYRKHLNMTPRAHLARVRLAHAHTALSAASPATTTVAEVAAQWGFNSSGRFAAQYRKVYGVVPYSTLSM